LFSASETTAALSRHLQEKI